MPSHLSKCRNWSYAHAWHAGCIIHGNCAPGQAVGLDRLSVESPVDAAIIRSQLSAISSSARCGYRLFWTPGFAKKVACERQRSHVVIKVMASTSTTKHLQCFALLFMLGLERRNSNARVPLTAANENDVISIHDSPQSVERTQNVHQSQHCVQHHHLKLRSAH